MTGKLYSGAGVTTQSSVVAIFLVIAAMVVATAAYAADTETVLYTFTGNTDGERPEGDLVFDTAGNL